MRRRHFLGTAGLVVLPLPSGAQTFPDKPIRFVVPYAPGGSTDTSARIVAERLSVLFG
jgi:tripartite-type tricarboxylate transporter receptor subunit TctC